MRYKRILMSLIVLVLCVQLSGCVKTWSVTFNGSEDVDGWDIYHINSDNDNWAISELGFELDGYYAIGPYSFTTADCTLTLVFDLQCDGSNTAYMSVEFADGNQLIVNRLRFALRDMGNVSAEAYWVDDGSGSLVTGATIPALDHDGENKIELIKKGNYLTVKLNSIVIYNGNYSYPLGYVVPYLACYMVDASAATLYFKSIKVQCDGEIIAR